MPPREPQLEARQGHSTSLSPRLAHLSPRTPQGEGPFTSQRGSGSAASSAGRQSNRSVSSSIRASGGSAHSVPNTTTMRKRVPSGVPARSFESPASPASSSVMNADERILPPIPTADSSNSSSSKDWKERLRKAGSIDSFKTKRNPVPATTISNLPGFSDAIDAAKRRPSNIGMETARAFGSRVRSFALGITATATTANSDTEGHAPIVASSADQRATQKIITGSAMSSWFKGRPVGAGVDTNEANTKGKGVMSSPRPSELLPPIDLPLQAQHSVPYQRSTSEPRRAFVEDADSEDEMDPDQTIRVVHAGNIILEQSGIASSPNSLASALDMWSPPPSSIREATQRFEEQGIYETTSPDKEQNVSSNAGRFKTEAPSVKHYSINPTHLQRGEESRSGSILSPQRQNATSTLGSRPFSISFASAPDMERTGTGASSNSTASYNSLLLPNSASSALADLGESLRWSQKFPEGAHMSRARSSRLSVGAMGGSSAPNGQARRNSAWSAAHPGGIKSNEDEKEKTIDWSGGHSWRQGSDLGVTALEHDHEIDADGYRTRVHRDGPHGERRHQRTLSTKSKLSETRNGLRFLSAKREDHDYDGDSSWDEPVKNSSAISDTGRDAGIGQPLCQSEERVAKWNRFKWILFVSVIVLFIYGMAGLVGSLLTWARTWERADVTAVVDADILIFLTLASMLCVLTSVVGISGTILNSRPILSLYAFLLWPTLLSILVVGYASYKRENLRLDRKLNMAWSRYFDDLDRLRLQNNLHCCGYYTPLHQATFSRNCYPRTSLPGCKGKLYRYEKAALKRLYTIIFSIVFVHLANIAASLLCSNHVNASFGKGLTPRAYRLDMTHVRRNAINIIRALKMSEERAQIEELHHREAGATHEKRHMAEEGVDLSLASIDLNAPPVGGIDERPSEIDIMRLQRNRGLLARALQVPYYSERPVLPPKSPARGATSYAFNGPQAALSHEDGAAQDPSKDVRGLGFTMSLERHQARLMQEQLLARQI